MLWKFRTRRSSTRTASYTGSAASNSRTRPSGTGTWKPSSIWHDKAPRECWSCRPSSTSCSASEPTRMRYPRSARNRSRRTAMSVQWASRRGVAARVGPEVELVLGGGGKKRPAVQWTPGRFTLQHVTPTTADVNGEQTPREATEPVSIAIVPLSALRLRQRGADLRRRHVPRVERPDAPSPLG